MLHLFSKPIVSQSEYTAGRAVSVWVGNFESEEALDEYLQKEEGFAADYGFRIDDRSPPEVSVEKEKIGMRELLTGFSLCDQFLEEALAEAGKKKIDSASAAAVFHFLAYPEKAVRSQKKMRYLGCFSAAGFK
jgi:hypothetical protein